MQEDLKMNAMLSPGKAAAFLGISTQTLANWRWLRKGPDYSRFGAKAVRYQVADLVAWRDACKVRLQDG